MKIHGRNLCIHLGERSQYIKLLCSGIQAHAVDMKIIVERFNLEEGDASAETKVL